VELLCQPFICSLMGAFFSRFQSSLRPIYSAAPKSSYSESTFESPKGEAEKLCISANEYHLLKHFFSPFLSCPKRILGYFVMHRLVVMTVPQSDGCEFSSE